MENIHTTSGRLATFTVSHPSKRRASSTKKRAVAAASASSWPHENPTPESLAKAGFYFHPSSSSPDNVTCHICQVNLDGWEEGDDAAAEHYAHKPECAIAITCHVKQVFIDSKNTIDEDPLGDKYRNARLETFQDLWPHEKKRAWKCKSAKLADAGWSFDPEIDAEDAVSCSYCNLSVGNWEPKDDPLKEHKRREPECPFFALADKYSSTRSNTKGKKRNSKTSKIDRSSVQSNASIMSKVPSTDLPDVEDDVDDSALTVISTISKAPLKKAKGRPKKKIVAVEHDNNEEGVEDEDEEEEEEDRNESVVDIDQHKKSNRRGTRKASTQLKTSTMKSGRGKKRFSDGSVKDEASPLPSKGTKRTSDGIPKLDISFHSDIVILEDPPSPVKEISPPKRTKKAKKNTTVAEPGTLPVLEADTVKKPATKAKKTKKPSREPLTELPIARDVTPISSASNASNPPTPTPARNKLTKAQRQSIQSQKSQKQSQSQNIHVQSQGQGLGQSIQIQSQNKSLQKSQSPSQSPPPQSSDAENQPPSKRPSIKGLTLQAISPLRPHLTPTASPSKRNAFISNLKTKVQWESVDLDAIFSSFSPSKNNNLDDKENRLANINISQLDKKSLGNIVKGVKANLSDEERKMTVEQWIRCNAQKSENKLKYEAESMVTMFEREGANAQRALEGIKHKS